MINQNEVLKKIALDTWTSQITRASKLFEGLTDEQLAKEVAPGKNSAFYLMGHLTAVHDAMFPLLGLGESLHPELVEVFIKNPDKSALKKPGVKELRESWNKVNTLLSSKLAALEGDQWFAKHNSVSEEDFKKEPHRNKLNVVLGRAGHAAYHLGQLNLLNK